jgi:ketosteroid isomerase-like protein
MSVAERNVRVVQAIHAAFNREDAATLGSLVHPDFEWDYSRSRGPAAGVYRGREMVLDAMAMMAESWETIRWDAEWFRARGDHEVLVRNCLTSRGAASGVEVEARAFQLWFLRDGAATAMRLYQELGDVPAYPAL